MNGELKYWKDGEPIIPDTSLDELKYWKDGEPYVVFTIETSAPTLVSPSDTTSGTSPVTFIWKIPSNIDNKPVHAHIQIDKTSDDFGDLERDLYSYKDAGFEYYNGTDWVAYPTTGVTSDYYGNQARITLNLTTGWKYWRVRGGVALS